MEYTIHFTVILCIWTMPAVETTCVIEPYTNLTSYGRYIHLGDMLACYQDQTNTMPSFPKYNQTFKSLALCGKWVMRHLHKSLLSGIPFMERLQLQNIGLQHLSCDVFTNIRDELTILNLDDNMLTHFPACSVNTLYHLKELTLSKNFINCIPEHSLPNFLETLDVSYNQISVVNHAVSTDIHNENLLKTFNITGNNLSSINKNEFQQFSTLQILDASENRLVYIHPRSFITSGRHLLVIDLSQNQLTSTIWLALENLQRVQNLNLSHNQIDRIDDNVISSIASLHTFDISYNMITEIETVFSYQQSFQGLYFQHNRITKVNELLLAFGTHLWYNFYLDLSFNLLTSVYLTMDPCSRCTFSVHHNKLQSLFLFPSRNSFFELIDISFNLFEKVPQIIPSCIFFNGSHNPFSTESVMELINLNFTKTPFVSYNNILRNTTFMCYQSSIPDNELFDIKDTLDLADNCVPSEFLCHLQIFSGNSNAYLNLDRNKILTLPKCSFDFSSRYQAYFYLSLKGNNINFVDEFFIWDKMTQVINLDLAENNLNFSSVQTLLSNRRNLLYLNISFNNLHRLPPMELSLFEECFYNCYMDSFYENDMNSFVDISNNALKHVTPIRIIVADNQYYLQLLTFTFSLLSFDNEIELLTDVLNLHGSLNQDNLWYYDKPSVKFVFDFSRNRITEISHLYNCSVPYFTEQALVVVNVTQNRMSEFPSCAILSDSNCLGDIILYLDFSKNFFHALPRNETCVIDKVEMLNVSHNRFTEIPQTVANSSTLRYLNMGSNKISTISRSAFIGLPNLKELDLSFNRLTTFPESIKSLSRLQTLNLVGNNILTIPDGSSSLWPSLSVFHFYGNPLLCSCSVAWLRNYTITTDQIQCKYPSALEGNMTTCLVDPLCVTNTSVYSSKENIQSCGTGLVVKSEDQSITWDLSLAPVHTTPQSNAEVDVFRDCRRVAKFSSVKGDNSTLLDYADEIGDVVCVTLSDKTWISNITRCLVLDRTRTRPVVQNVTTGQPSIQEEVETPHYIYIGIIVALSVLLITATCVGLGIHIVHKRRQSVSNQSRSVPNLSGQINTEYENYNEGDISLNTNSNTEVKRYYDSTQLDTSM